MVRWSNGVAVRSGETRLLFDPIDSDPTIPDIFITHAHFDHSRGFQFPLQKKHSTSETRALFEIDSSHKVGNWEPIRLGRRIHVGGLEVEAHDAGHILGSAQFEIVTRGENLVYASHLNFTDTLTTRAAEVAPCDTLIVEAAFPSSYHTLPTRDAVLADLVKWALECVRERRVPTFATEPIGNAQELIRVFNTWTELAVVVHPRIARISQVYQTNGVGLTYTDAGSEKAQALITSGECVVLVPRRFDTSKYGEFRLATVTPWPTQVENETGKIFPLSDQADLDQILKFVKEARPKSLLAFRGGSRVLTELVSRRTGIAARVLQVELPSRKSAKPSLDEGEVASCEEYILGVVQVPNLTYTRQELLLKVLGEGFKLQVVEEALKRLTAKRNLRYSEMTEGYSLA